MPKDTPHDKKSEQCLLAALMLEGKLIKQIDVVIDDFYDSKHQKIFQCICELFEDGLTPDLVSVNSKLTSKHWEKDIDAVYLSSLADGIPTAITKQWRTYLSIIKKKSAARKVLALANHMQRYAQNGLENLSDKIADSIANLLEIKEKAEGKHKSVKDKVLDWINATSGDFNATDCVRDLCAATERDKQTIRRCLQRFENENVIVRCGGKNGCYRMIEKDAPIIDFINVNLSEPYPVKWPFRLEELIDIYPGNVIVLAGEANAGKTAFLLNVVRKNMAHLKIEYFSSEMGPEEMHLRLRKFGDISINEWKFACREKTSNFADVIVPDALNIIDYLEINSEKPWMVGEQIRGIFNRLHRGIAVIALQKKTGTDIGRGGEFTLEKPRLYLSMERGKLKIVKGKNWSNPEINPNGMTWEFKLVQGCRFIQTDGSEWNLQ